MSDQPENPDPSVMDVIELRRRDQDPAVEQWREAVTGSTGARLRRALEANDELAREHAKCVLETHRLNAEVGSALSALAKASAEVERLRALLTKAYSANWQLIGESDRLRADCDRLRLRTTTPPETTQEQPMSYDPYGAYPTVQHIQPKRKPKRWPWVLGALLGLCLLGTVVSAVAGRDDAKTPGPVASKAVEIAKSAASRAPAKGLPSSAGPLTPSVTPGGYCATSHLGDHFTKGGVTYTCKGPKPYRWRAGAK